MPYIVVTGWYPTDIGEEVAKKFFEMLKQYPFDRSLGKETIPLAVTTNKKGIIILSVMDVKEGKLEDALTWVSSRMVLFHSIKGNEYKIRVWSTAVEALESIGMKMPE